MKWNFTYFHSLLIFTKNDFNVQIWIIEILYHDENCYYQEINIWRQREKKWTNDLTTEWAFNLSNLSSLWLML